MKLLSCVQLLAAPWTVAYKAPLSMGFSKQEFWSGFPFPSPRDLPDPGIEPGSPALQTESLLSEPSGEGMRFYSKCDFVPSTIFLGLSFALGHGESFSGGIQHPLLDGCSAASCSFGVLAGGDECTSLYPAIFLWHLPPFTV